MINLLLVILLPLPEFLLRRFWSLTNQYNASLRTPTGPEVQSLAEKHFSLIIYFNCYFQYYYRSLLLINILSLFFSPLCNCSAWPVCQPSELVKSVVIATDCRFSGRIWSLLLRLLIQSIWINPWLLPLLQLFGFCLSCNLNFV